MIFKWATIYYINDYGLLHTAKSVSLSPIKMGPHKVRTHFVKKMEILTKQIFYFIKKAFF